MTKPQKIFQAFALFQFLAYLQDFVLFEVATLSLLWYERADFELASHTMATALTVTQLHW